MHSMDKKDDNSTTSTEELFKRAMKNMASENEWLSSQKTILAVKEKSQSVEKE